MIGFNYKNLLLQIIQGSILLAAIAYPFYQKDNNPVLQFDDWGMSLLFALLCISYIIGVLIDFIADILESILVSKISPFIFLLTRGKFQGIELAHSKKIFQNLLEKAKQNNPSPIKNKNDLKQFGFDKIQFKDDKKTGKNYIYQVAKNLAFKNCSTYQEEQMESFFTLYIFTRNLSLSFIFVVIMLLWFPIYLNSIPHFWFKIAGFLTTSFILILASFRYNTYYARIMLGASYSPKNKESK